MNIPPINSKGLFTFGEPFSNLIPSNHEYTVLSVRNLDELVASGENPYDTIYVSVGMSEADFLDDVANNVPIVVFSTDGKELFYVPADRVLSQPTKTGHTYIERVLMIPIGTIPTDYNLETAISVLEDTVRDTIGVTASVNVVDTSATVQYTNKEHNAFMALLNNSKNVKETYRSKYNKLLVNFEKRGALIEKFETMYKNNICNTQG